MKYCKWNTEKLCNEEITEAEVIKMIHKLKDGDTIELSRFDDIITKEKRILIDTY